MLVMLLFIQCHFSLVHLMVSLSASAFEGGYRFDRMALPGPFDILAFASSLHERSNHRRKPAGAKGASPSRCAVTGTVCTERIVL